MSDGEDASPAVFPDSASFFAQDWSVMRELHQLDIVQVSNVHHVMDESTRCHLL